MNSRRDEVTREADLQSMEVNEEVVVVRLSNDGCSPKPTPEMRLSTDKSNCKGDYGCCGHMP